MLAPLTAPSLAAMTGIRHGFFTRLGGVSEGLYAGLNCGLGSNDDPERVLQNRGRVAVHLGAAQPEVVTVYQIHSATAVTIDRPLDRAHLPKADAVVTRTPGLAIGVLTADCTPVLFADPEAKVVAAAHAGWRGAVQGVLAATVQEMERHGARRDRMIAAIGPTISQEAYEVGPDFETEFLTLEPDNARFFVRRDAASRAHFDLPGYVAQDLASLGLAHIERVNPCTYENESLFFSFRRTTHRNEPDYGRQISAIVVT